MKIIRNTEILHPILKNCVQKIQSEIIDYHEVPIRLFETGRESDRQQMLLSKGKTQNAVTRHKFNLKNDPPLYVTAVDYVYFDTKWSWNLRDSTVISWYILFGNMVLDLCPELTWFGVNRKNINYCHFELRMEIMLKNLKKYPCVLY
jgi:hypothetical protein